MPEVQDLATLIRAGTPLIVIETAEETRAVETFRHVWSQVMRPLWRWTLTDGLVRLDVDTDPAEVPPDATATLMAIKQHAERGVYLLLDFHGQLRYAMTLRLLREIVERQGSAAHTLVLVSPKVELPAELGALHTKFSLRLPDEATLGKMVREEAFAYSREHQGKRVEIDAASLKAIVRNLAGLSLVDARGIARQLIFRDGAVGPDDLPQLAKLKFELLNRDGVLHFEYDTAQFAEVAGMARLKQWVAQRRAVFLGDNPPPGLDPPKGVLLLGVQGCGQEPRGEGDGRRLRRAAGAAGLRLDVQQVPRRDRAQPARIAQERRGPAAVRAVDRRDREGARDVDQRRRRVASACSDTS